MKMDLGQLDCVEAIDGLCSGQCPVTDFCTSRIETSDSTTVIIVMSVNMLIYIFQE